VHTYNTRTRGFHIVSDVPPGGYPPQQPQYPQQPPQPSYQPPPAQPQYQAPPAQPQYQAPPPGQPPYQQPGPPGPPGQPGQFQPVNPQAAKSGNGCLKAFLIVFAIFAVLTVAGIVVVAVFVNKAADTLNHTFGVADPSDYTLTIDKCTADASTGEFTASGTITNNSSARQAFNIQIDFNDADSNTKLASDDIVYSSSLDKGQKANWTATGFDPSNAAAGKSPNLQCKQSQVNYWPG
jgi:hypothetical protein